jgi:ABC-type taurine transport system ATPase subunit
VFQNYREALFPWRRAIDNILYPLKFIGVSRKGEKAWSASSSWCTSSTCAST